MSRLVLEVEGSVPPDHVPDCVVQDGSPRRLDPQSHCSSNSRAVSSTEASFVLTTADGTTLLDQAYRAEDRSPLIWLYNYQSGLTDPFGRVLFPQIVAQLVEDIASVAGAASR